MKTVLSTKLPRDQAERFQEVAKAQGETKSSLLKRLVTEFLQSVDKVDEPIPAGRPLQGVGLEKAISKHPPQDPYQEQTGALASASGLNNSLPSNGSINHSLNPAPLSSSGQSVHHNAEPSRSAASPKQSSGIGWLIFWGVVLLILLSTPVDTAGRAPKRLAQGIGPGNYRRRYQSVDTANGYN